MVILIDLDNVAADLMKKWLWTYNTKYGDNLKPSDIRHWDADIFAKKCTAKEYYALIDETSFFADLEVIPNSIEVTKRLIENGNVLYFVTATPFNNKTAAYDKNMWVNRYFPHIGEKHVIQTHKKYMVKGELLFDDSPTQLQEFTDMTVAMDMPYNQNIKTTYRAKNWLEFEDIVDSIW
jgi:5'-nucleotidase